MAPSNPTSPRLDRVAAFAVLATLLGGVGALGWLLGHLVSYDATGHRHEHSTHGYMQPLVQGGTLVALLGVALAVVAVALGRHAVARWADDWRSSGSHVPWVLAASLPVATFVGVEYLEGSIATRGLDLLAVGVPVQALIGLLVLALVRSLLTALVRVADRLAGSPRTPPRRADRAAARAATVVHRPRFAPMATNAALRAPPPLMP